MISVSLFSQPALNGIKVMLNIFNDKLELATAFSENLFQLSNEKEKLFIALSGGSTPEFIFQFLAKEYSSKIDWSRVHLFWGDERCVPPDDDDSNFGMTRKHLLSHIDIPEENIHRIKGENDPAVEADRYSKEIKNKVPSKNSFPAFDLVMLGIGEDGHTASIFPDQMKLLKSDKICEVAVQQSSSQKRITLTGRVINNAERIIFLVTGKKKAGIIREIMEGGPIKKEKYPAANINPVNGTINYFMDSEAAELLTII